MKIILNILIIFTFFTFGSVANAHPLDITGSEIMINKQTGELEVSTFIHPFLVNLLLEKNDLFTTYTEIIYDHPKVLTDYYQKKFSIQSDGQVCTFKSFNLPPKDEFEIFGGGVEVEASLSCNSVGRIEYTNSMFIEFSPLQTNQMFFYEAGDNRNSIYERILTSKIVSNSFDINNLNSVKKEIDTDDDGLTDVEEDIYRTDKNKQDTDGDGYSDKEEVDNGWDALSFEMSMGQQVRVAKKLEEVSEQVVENDINDQKVVVKDEDIVQKEYVKGESVASNAINSGVELVEIDKKTVKDSEKNEVKSQEILVTTNKVDNNIDKSGAKYFKTGNLQKYLEKINNLFERGDILSLLIIFVVIYFLGILHAFEAGHGKSILISYMVERDRVMSDGIRFSAFLSVTHLIDVVILVILFKVFSLVGEAQKYIGLIQKAGAYILLIIAIIYLVRSLMPQKSCQSYKSAGTLGIIAGLAPCTIGWALMITIISIGKVNWLIPIIAVFGLGIFSTLIVFSFLIIKFKDKVIGDSEKVSKYASIASSLLLVAIALLLIFKY